MVWFFLGLMLVVVGFFLVLEWCIGWCIFDVLLLIVMVYLLIIVMVIVGVW